MTVNQTNWIVHITAILLIINNLPLRAICGTLVAMDWFDYLYYIDTNTKEVTQGVQSPSKCCVAGFTYDCSNQILYATEGDNTNSMMAFNYSTGSSVPGTHIFFNDPAVDYVALELVGSTFYGYGHTIKNSQNPAQPHGFWIINYPDEQIVFSSDSIFDSVAVTGLAYDICTDTMYGVTAAANQLSELFTLNLETGAATFIGETGVVGMSALTFGENCVLYGSGGGINAETIEPDHPGRIYIIDVETGHATFFVDASTNDIDGLVFISDSKECMTKSPTLPPSISPTGNTKNPTQVTQPPTITPCPKNSRRSIRFRIVYRDIKKRCPELGKSDITNLICATMTEQRCIEVTDIKWECGSIIIEFTITSSDNDLLVEAVSIINGAAGTTVTITVEDDESFSVESVEEIFAESNSSDSNDDSSDEMHAQSAYDSINNMEQSKDVGHIVNNVSIQIDLWILVALLAVLEICVVCCYYLENKAY